MRMVEGDGELRTAIRATVLRHLPGGATEDDLAPHVRLADLGLDSVASINMLLDLEATLGLVFPDETLTPDLLGTLGGLETAVARLLSPSGSPPAPRGLAGHDARKPAL